jgi:hypothetical protein
VTENELDAREIDVRELGTVEDDDGKRKTRLKPT